MPNLILELYGEELPASAQQLFEQTCPDLFGKFFKDNNLVFSSIEASTSPCRLAIAAFQMEESTSIPAKSIKGPKICSSEAAIEGFCNQNGAVRQSLQEKDGYYYLSCPSTSLSTSELLSFILPQAIRSIPWKKTMRWTEDACFWPRPLRNIMCLFGSKVLKFQYNHLTSNSCTFGHKFLAPAKATIGCFEDYLPFLESNFVIPSAKSRKALIENQAGQHFEKHNLMPLLDQELLNEVVCLVERPCVGLGQIPQQYMNIPSELIAAVIKQHQKYFATYYESGDIAPYFLFVANKSDLHSKCITSGNERVLSARLADACFLYQSDLSVSMDERIGKLQSICFQEQLGSMWQKVCRLEKMCSFLSLSSEEKRLLELSARFCKHDLAGEIASEFPSLQGVMSSYYASCESLDAALAIKYHYAPITQDDPLPPTFLGCSLSLLDKVDSLVGLYIAGKRATGNKDPYGLRRLALGVVKILASGGRFNEVDLKQLLQSSAELYLSTNTLAIERSSFEKLSHENKPFEKFDPFAVATELSSFVKLRHEHMLLERFESSLVRAVVWSSKYKPALAEAQISAVKGFSLSASCAALQASFKRANNLFEANKSLIAEQDPIQLLSSLAKDSSLAEAEELLRALADYDSKASDYITSLEALPALSEPLNAFLDQVVVSGNVARVSLIGSVLARFNAYLDFKSIASFLSSSSQ